MMHTITNEMKVDALITSLVMREQEVFNYQVNIDNYVAGLAIAKADPDLTAMATRLTELLGTERQQQDNAQLMLTVVENQLTAMGEDVAALAVAKAAELKLAADAA